MKTLADFIATREACANLGERFSAEWFSDGPAHGYVYDGSSYIEQKADGTFYLLLHRDEFTAATVEELEPVLYAWCLTEFPEDFDMPEDVHAFLCKLQDAMGLQAFADALVLNSKETDPAVCHMQDKCDANQCAIDAVQDACEDDCTDDEMTAHLDKASDIYNRARPYIRGRGDA